MNEEQGQTYWQPGQDDEVAPGVEPAPLAEEQQEQEQVQEIIDQPLAWQASEYVQHDKQVLWYVSLVVITVALLGLAIFMKAWTFAALVVVMGVGVGVMAGRPPHIVRYILSEQGLQVDEKHFGYHDFRSFGVIQEDAFHSIVLIPNKRFMPTVNVYFPTELGEQIVDIFGDFLPMEHVQLDFVEKLARKIRF